MRNVKAFIFLKGSRSILYILNLIFKTVVSFEVHKHMAGRISVSSSAQIEKPKPVEASQAVKSGTAVSDFL